MSRQPGQARGSGAAIYVSRSCLAANDPKWLLNGGCGQILPGPFVDDAFRRAGYRVLHPETLSIDEQIAEYRDAAAMVFDEGSALHLATLVARNDCPIVVLCRRPWYRLLMEAHLRIFLGRRAPVTVRMISTQAAVARHGARFLVPDMSGLAALLEAIGLPPIPSDPVPAAAVATALAPILEAGGYLVGQDE